jgi:hypothetical protein
MAARRDDRKLETNGPSAMRSREMAGPYPLSDEAIDEALKRTSAGNYALGYMDGDAFNVFYVGRSDTDLRQRLHEWVGMPSRTALDGPPASAVYEPRPARRL